ncbi:hypothetical protein BJ973_001938 [Actinoplanes tereljensis]|uniref:G domain-containing protein n=1 Tax=Paractinoplanes tereljensis TaxID=571912 RepID=A0A919NK23_9ACTN|nr:GTPase [Actinoplanes tereljensis]GIF20155.1 hypothetical protein Ate02nite_28850 [Actinoplanes tereljensis]
MVDDLIESWLADLRTALAALDDGEADARWAEHTAEAGLRTAAYGPYDAGKSTLLKRLLVADGTEVPGWLTVAGHPETDESRPIRSGDLVYVDTPGTRSGVDASDELAHLTAEQADVLLVVVSPKLLGGDTARLLATVREAARRAPASVLFVITQLDTLQDPEYDPDGYRELAGRKRAELLALLATRDITGSAVHTVSADPYGRVGKKAAPQPADYGDSAGWDGIEELRADLATRLPRQDELRRAAAARYWTGTGTRAVAAARTRANGLQAELSDAQEHRRRAVALARRLDALDARARSDLHGSIRDEMTSAKSATAYASVDNLLTAIDQRLRGCVEAWLTRSGSELREIAEEAATEGALATTGPGSFRKYLHRVADLGETGAAGGGGKGRFGDIVTTGSAHAGRLSGEVFKIKHGMPVETARAELDRLKEFDAEKLAEYFAGEGKFGDKEHVEAVTKSVKTVDVVANIVPTVAEFGTLLFRQVTEEVREKRARAREAKLRKEINETADRIAEFLLANSPEQGGTGWARAVETIRAGIEAGAPGDDVVKTMIADLAAVERATLAVESILAREPR